LEQDLEYNTERETLIIPEYGRHIQKMVDYAISIEDPVERNKVAKSIIGVMGNLNPHLRDVTDFQHKLWDQLFIMSRFQLDVDCPFPKLNPEVLSEKPETLSYPKQLTKFRFYGNIIREMIQVALSWEKGPKRDALEVNIATQMKKSFLVWNKDSVEDDVIFNHLFEISDGKIDLKVKNETLTESEELKRQNKKFPLDATKIAKKRHAAKSKKRFSK